MSCFGAEDDALKEQRKQNKLIDAQLKKDKDVYKATHRLLLLGNVHCVNNSISVCVEVLITYFLCNVCHVQAT